VGWAPERDTARGFERIGTDVGAVAFGAVAFTGSAADGGASLGGGAKTGAGTSLVPAAAAGTFERVASAAFAASALAGRARSHPTLAPTATPSRQPPRTTLRTGERRGPTEPSGVVRVVTGADVPGVKSFRAEDGG